MTSGVPAEPHHTMVLRRILFGILLLGLVGTEAELLLLEHYEDWQLVPLVLIGLTLLVLAWHGLAGGAASVRAIQVMMALSLVAGLAGLALHYKGNVEFELEMYPSMAGRELIWAALTGATPALAPGTMIQLGLIGLAFTYRHPSTRRS